MADGVTDVVSESTPWILGSPPDPTAKLRLFCFPYAGAGASVFHGWRAALPVGVAVCAVQPPGRENRMREPAFTEMGPLVEAAARALRPHLRPPFALFGHSLGALLAFELARLLRREGAAGPVCLFASGCRAPQLQRPAERPSHRLPRADFIAQLRRFKGTPEAVLNNAELLEVLLPALLADFAVAETYPYKEEEPLGSPITVFGGAEDEQVDGRGLAAWAAQTAGAFRLHRLPGGHFFLRTDRALLLQSLSASLKPILLNAS
jgi:medium-chain acyl-[acyl-carrier-protein] hydrolase